jgi:hypothetical protein
MAQMLHVAAGEIDKTAMEPGFAYGIECRQREGAWPPPEQLVTTWQIFKALILNWRHVKALTDRKATAKEIGAYIAGFIVKPDGLTLAKYFAKHKQSGATEAQYHKLFQKLCGKVGIPLPHRGAPRRPPANSPCK